MRRGALGISIITLTFLMTSAQAADTDAQQVVSDLNVVAPYLLKPELTNEDVVLVASIACSMMRVTRTQRLLENARRLMNERYPTKEDVAAIDVGEFADFELGILRKYGANEDAITLVSQTIKENPSLPITSPAQDVSLESELSSLETISCSLREVRYQPPSAPAGSETSSLTRSIGKATVAVVVIMADVAITVETGGTLGTIVGIVSGGWGWNRIEEAFPFIGNVWDAIEKPK